MILISPCQKVHVLFYCEHYALLNTETLCMWYSDCTSYKHGMQSVYSLINCTHHMLLFFHLDLVWTACLCAAGCRDGYLQTTATVCVWEDIYKLSLHNQDCWDSSMLEIKSPPLHFFFSALFLCLLKSTTTTTSTAPVVSQVRPPPLSSWLSHPMGSRLRMAPPLQVTLCVYVDYWESNKTVHLCLIT